MKKTTVDCDRCGMKDIANRSLWVSVSVVHESQGPTKESFDLCHPCAAIVLATIKDQAGRQT